MKTTGFAVLKAECGPNGTVVIGATDPTEGAFTIDMSAEEAYLFLVELGNVLAQARKAEVVRRQEDDLKKEMRR